MDWIDTFQIRDKDVVSIVGSGGKTSLMFTLAEALRKRKRVLVTTSTKIYCPHSAQYDALFIDQPVKINGNGVYVCGRAIPLENKLIAPLSDDLIQWIHLVDVTLIEADGSKKLPLKGWNEHEPVVIDQTTKTIGVLPMHLIGQTIDENIVHRLPIFLELTHSKQGEILTLDHFIRLINDPLGLFKSAKGEKVLWLSHVETEERMLLSEELKSRLAIKTLYGTITKRGES